ncbi:MAG: hypothetical protein HGB30_15030, partial [Holophagaceae bacterium]|nr:hypothetical protein [Holophagaceae bacterium]
VDYHARALARAKAVGLRTVEAECQFYGAEVERFLRHFKDAREGYQRVLELLPVGVTPGVRRDAQAGLAECLLRQPRPDAKEAARLLAEIPPGSLGSPYVHRALAWSALRAGQREVALQEVAKALADPKRQAPEIQAELDQLRAELLAGGRP